MGHTGYVDWHRLGRSQPWARTVDGKHTFVYAFWLVDYGRNGTDHGVTLLKAERRHPDWFLHAERADQVLTAYCNPRSHASPSVTDAFGPDLAAKPLLAAVLLGTNSGHFNTTDGQWGWWCATDDLTRRGRKLIRQLSKLYERRPVLVTFVDTPTDEDSGPRDPA